MISPSDIQTKEFLHGVRGYKEEDVDQFLDELTLDYDNVLKQNAALEAENAELKSKIESYKTQENSLIGTLEAAKSLMNEIAGSAEKRADLIIKNAEIDAEGIVRDAKLRLSAIQKEERDIADRISSFKKAYKGLLESALSTFDPLNFEVEKESADSADKEFYDLLNSVENREPAENIDDTISNLTEDFTKTIANVRKDTSD